MPDAKKPRISLDNEKGATAAFSSDGLEFPKQLEDDFANVVFAIGLQECTPNTLLRLMPRDIGIKADHIKSHLQKCRKDPLQTMKDFRNLYVSHIKDNFAEFNKKQDWTTNSSIGNLEVFMRECEALERLHEIYAAATSEVEKCNTYLCEILDKIENFDNVTQSYQCNNSEEDALTISSTDFDAVWSHEQLISELVPGASTSTTPHRSLDIFELLDVSNDFSDINNPEKPIIFDDFLQP